MNCKICNRISKSSFCSQECKDIFLVQNTKIKKKKIKKPKIKVQKLRFCVCGEELKRYQHICNKCKLKLRDEELEKRVEYGILGKCLGCGCDIVGFINKKYPKKFCTIECSKKYRYALAKKNCTL